ncbi:MAG: SDR family NAD(P)-dependent oxidoreductase, partial [Bacteroidota bacterium]
MLLAAAARCSEALSSSMGALWSSSSPEPAPRVWVTGASSGLGEAIAYEYARQKRASLVLSARREDRLQEVSARCRALGARTAVVALDQERLDPRKVDEALKAFGGLDVAVINGGVSSRGAALDTDLPTLRRVAEINFLASAEIGRRVARDMRERDIKGRLVVVSSVQSFFGLPGRSAYGASKHALKGYFDALRADGLRAIDHRGERRVRPRLHTDIGAAVQGAELILAPLPAFAQS